MPKDIDIKEWLASRSRSQIKPCPAAIAWAQARGLKTMSEAWGMMCGDCLEYDDDAYQEWLVWLLFAVEDAYADYRGLALRMMRALPYQDHTVYDDIARTPGLGEALAAAQDHCPEAGLNVLIDYGLNEVSKAESPAVRAKLLLKSNLCKAVVYPSLSAAWWYNSFLCDIRLYMRYSRDSITAKEVRRDIVNALFTMNPFCEEPAGANNT